MSYDKDAERWPAWGDKASQDRLTNPQYDLDHRDGPTRKLDIKYPYKPRAGVTYQDVQDRLKELDPLAVSLARRDPSTTSLSIPEEYPKDVESAKETYKNSPNRTIKDVDSSAASKVVREVATDSSFVKFVSKIPVLSKYLVVGFLVLGAQDAWAKGGAIGLAKFTARSGMEFILGDIITLNEMAEIIRKTSRKETSKMIDQSPIPSQPGRFYSK